MSWRIRLGLIFIGLITLPFAVGLLFSYEIINFDFTSFMEVQPSIGYQEGPAIAPPPDSVPVEGMAFVVGDESPINPVPPDNVSLQRGEILYDIHCGICHGESGQGDGPLAEEFDPPPSDFLASPTVDKADGEWFITLTAGFGSMPQMTENLTVRERWDVINYIRSLSPR